MSLKNWITLKSITRPVGDHTLKFYQVNALFLRRSGPALQAVINAWVTFQDDTEIEQGVSHTNDGEDSVSVVVPPKSHELSREHYSRRTKTLDTLVERLTDPATIEALTLLIVCSLRDEYEDRSERKLREEAAKLAEEAPLAVLIECGMYAIEAQSEAFEDFIEGLRENLGALKEKVKEAMRKVTEPEEKIPVMPTTTTPSETLETASPS